MRLAISTLCAVLVGFSLAAGAEPPLPNPFYAMDTCTKRPYPRNDITPAEQFDLLKELGYKGIAWTEESPGAVRGREGCRGPRPEDVHHLLLRHRDRRGRAQALAADRADHGNAARPRHRDLAAPGRQGAKD